MQTLDFVDLLSLAELYEGWAFYEEKINPDQQTMLVQWSADYEAIAAFFGPGWNATAPDDWPNAMTFIAKSIRADQ